MNADESPAASNDLQRAAELLRRGELVAFPTETVYGLGADATNPSAVARIFAAKGRPTTNPLIVHVADVAVARRCAAHWPDQARQLAEIFWPGPLTLVVAKAASIVPGVTAHLYTVGLRAPDHPLALELLRCFGGPVAAPSANRSNHISPTTAQHVRDEFGSTVQLVLDGGPCRVGIESTVLDLTAPLPTILRPGAVTREQLEQVVGPVNVFQGSASIAVSAPSPGQQEVHYAPATPAYRFERPQFAAVWRRHGGAAGRAGALFFDEGPPEADGTATAFYMPADPEDYARRLYALLRDLDGMKLEVILVEMPPDRPEWLAVRDRLMRATRKVDF